MDDGERAIEIDRLFKELSEATARKTALLAEAYELEARIHEIRAEFGNPFFYSHPEHGDESEANYTGSRSHDEVLPTVLALRRVEIEVRKIKEQLQALGISAD